jgi:NAD(P)-dependent dehydrogenase (short-subunit alcohol dehydrogenase family)
MAANPQPAGDGPVVVVTGASAGVGRAVARAYGRRGARVGLIARNEDGLRAAAREVEEAGGRALVLPTDVADAEAVERAAARVAAELGPIDIWVNDAMASVLAPLWRIEAGEFRRTTEVTYLGQVHGTMAALRRMLPSDRGTIVQVGSALAYRGIPLQSAYCGAKHAVRGFTDALRCELRHEGSNVRVVTVHLPALNTTQFDLVRTRLPRHPRPVAPVFQPEVAADAIVWAADHPHRREVWVGGSTVLTIIGNRIAPWLADWYLARKGVDAQQTDQPVDDRRLHTDYLFQPVPGDHGVHGRFDDESKPASRQLWLTKHRRALLAAGAAGVAAIGAGAGALAAGHR